MKASVIGPTFVKAMHGKPVDYPLHTQDKRHHDKDPYRNVQF
jgi:hypothetical protein